MTTALTPLEAVQQLQEDAATFHALVASLKVWNVLFHSGAAVAHTGDTVLTALQTILVPAGSLGPNGLLRVTNLWSYTNSANAKNLKTFLGGTGGTAFSAVAPTTSALYREQLLIANRNAENSQVGAPSNFPGSFGTSANAKVTAAIDTTADQNLVIACQLASSGETITLEDCLVEMLHGD